MKSIEERGRIELSLMVSFILMLIVLIGLIFLVYNLTTTAQQKALDAGCKTSIDTLSKLKTSWKLEAKDYIKIMECPTEFSTFKGGNKEKAKAYIAKQMASCWNKMGEGKKEVFRHKEWIFCAVCDVIEFPRIDEIRGLPDYLKTTSVLGKRMSYSEYFDYTPNPVHNVISTKDKLAIVYVHAKKTRFGEAYHLFRALHETDGFKTLGHTAAYATAYVFGSEESETYQARPVLVSYSKEQLRDFLKCDYIVE